MKNTKVQCPAKINLTLKVINKREDGFHNIESIMQTINLFDYLDITLSKSNKNEIILTGNSTEIPYNENNLVYKAAQLYFETTNLQNYKLNIYIEKNIPIAAGLAGGSTNAAGTIFGLNKLFNNLLSNKELHDLCAKLGSDLNVCLQGGRLKTTSRGEIIEPMEFVDFDVNLIKPLNLGISAKEAYSCFAQKIKSSDATSRKNYVNDLEWAIIENYKQLKYIKSKYPGSIMTGSGSTYFSTEETFNQENGYWIKNKLKAIPYGVQII